MTMNRIDTRYLLVLAAMLLMLAPLHAQRRNSRYSEYIRQHAPVAEEKRRKQTRPASPTRAQGQ